MLTKIIMPEQLDALKNELDNIAVWITTPPAKEVRKTEAYISEYHSKTKRQQEIKKILAIEERRNVRIGEGVTVCLYSDRHAYTIIRRTRNKLFIQRDTATLKKDSKPEMVKGGFTGFVANNDSLKYDYAQNPENPVDVAYWSEKRGCFTLNDCPIVNGKSEYFDYSF